MAPGSNDSNVGGSRSTSLTERIETAERDIIALKLRNKEKDEV